MLHGLLVNVCSHADFLMSSFSRNYRAVFHSGCHDVILPTMHQDSQPNRLLANTCVLAISHPIGSARISPCGWICVSLRTSDERAMPSRRQHHGVGWGAVTRHTMRTLSSLHHCKRGQTPVLASAPLPRQRSLGKKKDPLAGL